jgi:hypothetical protein
MATYVRARAGRDHACHLAAQAKWCAKPRSAGRRKHPFLQSEPANRVLPPSVQPSGSSASPRRPRRTLRRISATGTCVSSRAAGPGCKNRSARRGTRRHRHHEYARPHASRKREPPGTRRARPPPRALPCEIDAVGPKAGSACPRCGGAAAPTPAGLGLPLFARVRRPSCSVTAASWQRALVTTAGRSCVRASVICACSPARLWRLC